MPILNPWRPSKSRFWPAVKWRHDAAGIREVQAKSPPGERKYLACLLLLRVGQKPIAVCEVEGVSTAKLKLFIRRYNDTALDELGGYACQVKKEKLTQPPLVIPSKLAGKILLKVNYSKGESRRLWQAVLMVCLRPMSLSEVARELKLKEEVIRQFWNKEKDNLN